MRRILITVSLLLLVATGPVWAKDLVAVWECTDGNTMTLSVRDDGHIRMDTASESYTLLTGGKIYAVSKDDDGWKATDMAQMAGIMGGMFGQQKTSDANDYKATYTFTGRTETIAGYAGKIYRVEVRDGGGKLVSSDELVLSKAKEIRRINIAMVQISSKMSSMAMPGMAESIDSAEKQADNYGSVLRYGKDMTLASVKYTSLGPDYFDLPKGTTQEEIPAPRKASQTNSEFAGEKSTGENGGGFFGGLLKSSGDAAKEQTQSNTTDEVKQGVNKLFKSLFKKE